MGLSKLLGFGGGPKGNFTDPRELVRQQDLLNRYNISSPFGSRSYTKDAEGRTVLNIQETPYQQALRQLQEKQAMDVLGSKAPSAADFQQQGDDVRRALYETSMYTLRPQFEREDTQIADYLSNRGIPLGSTAYQRALSGLRRDRGQQLNQLGLQSTLAASQEQDRLVRLAELQRQARLAETGSATQGIDMSIFGNTAAIDAAGIIGSQEAAMNQFNQNRFNSQQQRRSQALTEGLKGGALIFAGGPAAGAGAGLLGGGGGTFGKAAKFPTS